MLRTPRAAWARFAAFSFRDANPIVLGSAMLVAVALVCAGVFAVGSLGLLRHRYTMSGVFADSAGLSKGDLVRVAGVDVGSVTAVRPDFAHGNVVITWKVNHGVQLGPRTTAEISLTTLLGGKYLKLGGPVDRPFLESLPESQRRIPLAHTRLPATIEQVLTSATHAVGQVDAGAVNQLLGQLGDLTTDNQGTIGELAANLATVAGAVNERQHELDRLVTNAQQVSATLAAKDQSLNQLVDSAGSLLDAVSRRRDQLAQLLGSGSQLVTTLSTLVAQHRAELDSIIGDVHATLDLTSRHTGEIDSQLAFLGPAFTGLASITRAGPWLDAIGYGLGPLDINTLTNLVDPKKR
jgi:phospholipid/cholesterol/gamma-HCH transport system substrate-binding protein